MPRDPLAWLPLLRHWAQCLGEGPEAIARMGDLGALPELDLAALLPGGPGWSDVQRSLRHDPEGAFRLLYYGLALRGLVAMANGTRFEVIVHPYFRQGFVIQRRMSLQRRLHWAPRWQPRLPDRASVRKSFSPDLDTE